MKNTHTAWGFCVSMIALASFFAAAPAKAATPLDSEESAFLTIINNYRAQNGVGPLQVSATLRDSSLWMSTDMATKNYFSHTDSLGRSAGARIAAFGYPYFPWGENIAAGYSDAQNTFVLLRDACDPDSSGACTYAHRLNMLNAGFKAIGISRAYNAGSTYRWYWTTDFGGVVDVPLSGTPAPTIASFTASAASISPGQSVTLAWSVSGATSLSIDQSVGGVTGLSSKTVFPTATTTYTLTASNSGGSVTKQVTVTVTAPPPTTGFTPIRVNAGGTAYVDSLGQTWAADTGYSGGNTWSVSNSIANTNAPALYQTCRWGSFSYHYSVPNGSYTVKLKFAEVSRAGSGQRLFSVAINGGAVLSNFDIFASAGGEFVALDKPFPVNVSNGQIAIQFSPGAVDQPMVNAIEIVQAASVAFAPIHINAGGPAVVDPLGQTWSADTSYTGGNPWSVSNSIANTNTPAIYQTCRWGSFSYNFSVPNGSYTVKLKFAEVSRNRAGQRLFNVALNGATVLSSFDIFAAAGGEFIALDKTFPVNVSNGQITVQFTPGAVDQPMVNAIEISQ
ncbi:MAG TPA: malectin domain-containing carbohydrate-binding protein [Bryobacteraceae bacterium]|jgi:uncharacterized protein YkwD